MKVLIIRPGALGDTVICIPCLMVLGRAHEVYFLGRGPGLYFVERFVSHAWDMEQGQWHALFQEPPNPCPIKDLSPDLVVGFLRSNQETLSINLRSWFPRANIFLFPGSPDPIRERKHVLRYIQERLRESGLSIRAEEVKGVIRSGIVPIDSYPKLRVVYHVGSGSVRKNYEMDFWLRLRGLVSDLWPEMEHIFLLGPAEACWIEGQKDGIEGIQTRLCLDPKGLEEILGTAALFLGHDSGPTHLAALMGVPTICFFKEGSIKAWRPVGRYAKAIGPVHGDVILGAIRCAIQKLKAVDFALSGKEN